LGIRRGAIVLILLLGYLYFKLAGEAYALVSIGLISFAAVAQFAPAILGGIFWKGGARAGALCGLSAGFAVWLYTLLLPALARSEWLPTGLLEQGPFGIELLKPLQLFGLGGLDQISHAMIWSMIANVGAYVVVSLCVSPSADEHRQASLFVDVFRQTGEGGGARFWRGTASVPDLYSVLARFLGTATADSAFRDYAGAKGLNWPDEHLLADAERNKFLGIIAKEAERLTRLINQVLDLAKIESGKADWAQAQVDMKEVIADTLAAMDQLFREKNIRVEAQLPDKVSAVTVDLDRMVQVMLNLLSNAVKFCDGANGRIEIALAASYACPR